MSPQPPARSLVWSCSATAHCSIPGFLPLCDATLLPPMVCQGWGCAESPHQDCWGAALGSTRAARKFPELGSRCAGPITRRCSPAGWAEVPHSPNLFALSPSSGPLVKSGAQPLQRCQGGSLHSLQTWTGWSHHLMPLDFLGCFHHPQPWSAAAATLPLLHLTLCSAQPHLSS